MPIITDDAGTRVISDAELNVLLQSADAEFERFWASLSWRDIAGYDRSGGETVLVRANDTWAIACWGCPASGANAELSDLPATWRDAQESMDDAPLSFTPTQFAPVDDRWRAALMAD